MPRGSWRSKIVSKHSWVCVWYRLSTHGLMGAFMVEKSINRCWSWRLHSTATEYHLRGATVGGNSCFCEVLRGIQLATVLQPDSWGAQFYRMKTVHQQHLFLVKRGPFRDGRSCKEEGPQWVMVCDPYHSPGPPGSPPTPSSCKLSFLMQCSQENLKGV